MLPDSVAGDVVEALLGLLSSEQAQVAELTALLQREADALATRDSELMAAIAQEKGHLLAQLEGVARQQQGVIERAGFPAGRAGLAQLLTAAKSAPLSAAWSELEVQLRTCQSQNQINGQILEANRRQAQQLLSILLGDGASPAELYTAKGNTTFSSATTQTRTKA